MKTGLVFVFSAVFAVQTAAAAGVGFEKRSPSQTYARRAPNIAMSTTSEPTESGGGGSCCCSSGSCHRQGCPSGSSRIGDCTTSLGTHLYCCSSGGASLV